MSLFRKKSVEHMIAASAQNAGLKKALGALDLTASVSAPSSAPAFSC
jgi:hypothetical protein